MLKFKTRSMGPPGGFRYRQPETGQDFVGPSFDNVMGQILIHRRGHNLPMENGWEEQVEDAMCFSRGDDDVCYDPTNPKPFTSALERMGRSLWKALHEKGKSVPQGVLDTFARREVNTWLRKWEEGIPNFPGKCDCRSHYFDILKEMPAVFATGEEFYEWGVRVHNAISAKLGKPIWERPKL